MPLNADQLEQIRDLIFSPFSEGLSNKLDQHAEQMRDQFEAMKEAVSAEHHKIAERVESLEEKEATLDKRLTDLEAIKWKAMLGWTFMLAVITFAINWAKGHTLTIFRKITGAGQ